MRGFPSSWVLALAAAGFGASLVLGGAAFAEAKRVQAAPLQDSIDSFVAYLKSETYDVASQAERLAREHKDAIASAESNLRSHLAELGAALSGRKETAETLANDAMARLDAWSKSAGVSWAEARRQAERLLDSFETWLRSQAPSNKTEEFPV